MANWIRDQVTWHATTVAHVLRATHLAVWLVPALGAAVIWLLNLSPAIRPYLSKDAAETMSPAVLAGGVAVAAALVAAEERLPFVIEVPPRLISNRRVVALMVAMLWTYAVSKTFDDHWWDAILHPTGLDHDLFEENLELLGHLLFAALTLVSAFVPALGGSER